MTTSITSYNRTVIVESPDQILELIASESDDDAYETARLILETIGGQACAILANDPLTSGDDDHFDYTPAIIDLISDAYHAANHDEQGDATDDACTAVKYLRLIVTCEPQTFNTFTPLNDTVCTHVRALDARCPMFDDLLRHDYETCPQLNNL